MLVFLEKRQTHVIFPTNDFFRGASNIRMFATSFSWKKVSLLYNIVMNSTKRWLFASRSCERERQEEVRNAPRQMKFVHENARSVPRNAPENLFYRVVKTKVCIPRQMGKLCGPTMKGITWERWIYYTCTHYTCVEYRNEIWQMRTR